MTRVAKIELREIRLPLKEPFRISSGLCTERRIMLLHLWDADGADVWSECVAGEAPNYTAETIDTAWFSITEYVAPRVLDVDFAHPSEVDTVLELNFRGHNMAKAAIEMGIWGLTAVRENISLSRLLGGTREGIETGISIGIQANPAELVKRVERAVGEHYRKIKMKIQPGSDVEFVRAVRSAFPKAPLMADANNAYTLADTDRLKQLDDLDLIMIEQPLAFDDIIRHAQLQKIMKTRICLDESITSVEKAEDMISLDAGRIINIKPGRVAGFAQSRAIHDLCVKNKIPVWCGGMLESGVGRAYNVALASLPGFSIAGDLSPSARYWEKDVVSPEWTMSNDGIVSVPRDKSGLGVAVDVARVDNLTVRTQMLGEK